MADDLPGLAHFRRKSTIPLGTGEHEHTKWGLRDLLQAEAVDFVQLDIARAGGFTEMLKVAALAEAWNKPLAPHGMEHMHAPLVAAVPNGYILERLFTFSGAADGLFGPSSRPVDGYLTISEAPGLGLTIDEDFLAEYSEDK